MNAQSTVDPVPQLVDRVVKWAWSHSLNCLSWSCELEHLSWSEDGSGRTLRQVGMVKCGIWHLLLHGSGQQGKSGTCCYMDLISKAALVLVAKWI